MFKVTCFRCGYPHELRTDGLLNAKISYVCRCLQMITKDHFLWMITQIQRDPLEYVRGK